MNKIQKNLIRIAAENNTTVEEVRKEISAAIEAGINNPDPEIQKVWRSMSKTGGIPTPEEAIRCIIRKTKKKINDGRTAPF